MQTLQISSDQCSHCNSGLLAGDRFCETCGTPCPSPSPTACTHCGALALDTEGFCQQCGLRSPQGDEPLQLQLSLDCAGLSDRGLQRYLNQDAIAILAWPDTQPESWGLVVCDGIGSSARAEQAAQLAAATVGESLQASLQASFQDPLQKQFQAQIMLPQTLDSLLVGCLGRSLDQAQQAVAHLAQGEANAPATTVVVAVIRDRQLAVGWLGDSRAYWLAAQGSCQLTQDHSDAAHRLTRWLGADADLHQYPPQFVCRELLDSGYVLLCSDGLWNYAPEPEQLWQILHPPEAAAAAADLDADGARDCAWAPEPDTAILTQRLIDFARSQGGHDNISAVLLRITHQSA
ncbi:MAG: hypothetical protein HC771_04700 [Synechococcales cyanobacterium CRU_2_2]|nr:hypothetical protein [Synechococcales cyanobacterium CRU_2_2]